MPNIFLTFLGISAILVFVVWKAFFKWLEDHHSHWKFMRTKVLFILYVQYHKLFGKKDETTDDNKKTSLQLRVMDKAFHLLFKKDFSNHTIKDAKQLLKKTRQGRDGFLQVTMPPINLKPSEMYTLSNETITNVKTGNTDIIWVNKNNLKNGLIISFHGGAYVSACAKSCLPYLLPICNNTQMAGVSVEYGLAPEHPLPFAIDESYNVLKYLIDKHKINPKKISLIGDSAGASLVILLLQKIQSGLLLFLFLVICCVLFSCNDFCFHVMFLFFF